MKEKAAKTGPGAMTLVAIEQAFPEDARIITDELALSILPPGPRINAWLMQRVRNWLVKKSEQRVPGLWGGIMGRKRYIDDEAVRARADGIEAVVNLGAGFDTRSYRLSALEGTPTWEVDLPVNIRAKQTRLERINGGIPPNVTLVPIDFDNESLPAVLNAHGYTFDQKTFFIWEGVTQYLTEAGVLGTLDVLRQSPAGSRLVFTYVPSDFIAGEQLFGQGYLYEQMIQRDELWHFGIHPRDVGALLDDHGFQIREHLGYDDLAERYVKPTGRELGFMEIERIVCAEREPDNEEC